MIRLLTGHSNEMITDEDIELLFFIPDNRNELRYPEIFLIPCFELSEKLGRL